ncbi:MAG: alpha/beta hydrolase [Lachnospiraceae bacterium]|nr:alpha/beta hydrolase [Lachnospiraceae bacterium]
MLKEEFTYKSSDGETDIHAIRWIPDGKIKLVLQIAHGMAEYIDRYDAFATFLAGKGVLVTGNDHLGHGKSIRDEEDLGFFSSADGNRKVLSDMDELRRITKEKYPDVPYFLMGHSMGSFLCRQYIAESGDKLNGAIIMGTGLQPAFLTALAKSLCTIIASFKGWHHRSPFIDNMAFGSYNSGFGEKGGTDWLSVNKENVDRYNADPLCGYMFTLNGYYNMFHSINKLADKKYIANMPKKLPVLITSGGKDPVGDGGSAPALLTGQFEKMGMEDVTLKLYPDDRHEILNEDDRETVYNDIYTWLKSKV